MAKPWEEYQNTSSAPWEEYAQGTPDETTAETARLARQPVPQVKQPFSMGVSVDPTTSLGKAFTAINEKMQPRADGSARSRFVEGAMNSVYGVGQLGMNIVGQGDEINAQMAERQQRLDAAKEAAGVEGIDWAGIGGEILSPLNLIGGKYIDKAGNALIKPGMKQMAAKGAAFAAMQPVTTEGTTNYWTEKATQLGVGAVGGVVVDKGIGALGTLGSIVRTHTTQAGRQNALRKHIDSLAGPERDTVIRKLQDAQELVTGSKPTAAEVLSDLPTAVNLISKQGKLANEEGILQSLFTQRTAEQQAARVRALQGISGTEASRAAVAATRDRVTGEAREAALDQANVAGPIYTRLEKEIADGFNNLAAAQQTAGQVGNAARTQASISAQGQPGWLTRGDIASDAAGRAAAYGQKAETIRSNIRLKQYQQDSLEKHGFFPLRASELADSIDGLIRNSKSDMAKQVLQNTKTNILSRADESGIVNSRDLYENVRKELNRDIAKLLGQGDQFAAGGLPQQAAKSASDIKKAIDASLDKTSGGLWSKYLGDYQKYSQKLNQMEVGQYLVDKLNAPGLDKERVGVFANAVADAAGTIKRSTGIPRYDKLTDVLEPKQMAVVTNVLEDLKRGDMARRMQKSAAEGGLPDAQKVLPPLLSSTVAVARSVLAYIQQGNQKKFNEELGKLLLEPQKMATFLANVPKNRVEALTQAMMKAATPENRQRMVLMFTVPPLASESGEGMGSFIDRGE